MKKVLVLVLALALLCSSALAAEIGFLPPAMTSPFYASCIEGATPRRRGERLRPLGHVPAD